MRIEFKHLEDLLRCNKNIKIKFIDNSNILEIKNLSTVIAKIEFHNNNLEEKATDTKTSNAKAPKTGDTTQVMELVIITIAGIIVAMSAFKNRINE